MAQNIHIMIRRICWALKSGFLRPRSRTVTRFVIVQWLGALFLLFLWFRFNGGLWPWFLPGGVGGKHTGHGEGAKETDVNPLDYFTSVHHDAALISWTDAVNTRDAILQAVTTAETMMMIADVNSDGNMPLMCSLPLEKTSMTFDTWLDIARHRRKGFRLRFYSILAVEKALSKLRRFMDELRMPIQLQAVVMGSDPYPTPSVSPNDPPIQPVIPVDAFLRLTTTQFPPSTLVLSWSHLAPPRTGAISERENSVVRERYDWTDVKQMYDAIERWQLKQPINFLVQNASVVRRSVSQIKWLMEMTDASLTVGHHIPGNSLNGKNSDNNVDKLETPPKEEEKDSVRVDTARELVAIRQHFPSHSVYYDLDNVLRETFLPIRDERVEDDLDLTFKSDQWKVVRSRDGERIYLGTESVLMQTGLLLTKDEHLADKERGNVIIRGHVEFLDDPNEEVADSPAEETSKEDVGLAVFLRATQSSRPDSISGIRCFMSAEKTGKLLIETRSVPGSDAEVAGVLPGTAPCFIFTITDSGSGAGASITMNVTRPRSCDEPYKSGVDFSTLLTLPMSNVNTEAGYIAIRQTPLAGSRRRVYTAVDQFSIKRSRGAL